MAKKAHVLGVKVFQGKRGSTSVIIDGYDWAVDDILSKNRKGKAVINMSLGGEVSNSLNDAINDAASQGIITVAAAGNYGRDASTSSPASAESAITVGAVGPQWNIWESEQTGAGSNYGENLDIFAPGVNIISAGHEDDSGTAVYTGTSMATPHVSGLVLYAISVDGVTGTKAVTDHILKNGGKGVVGGNLRGSPSLMANNGNSQQ